MEEPTFSCTILSKLNLDDIEKVVKEAYHKEGSSGRPPRKPMGIFKALMVKRLQQIPSERELCRRLWKDENLRELCDLEADQNPYHPSQLSRFKRRIGPRRLQKINHKTLQQHVVAILHGGEKILEDVYLIKYHAKVFAGDNWAEDWGERTAKIIEESDKAFFTPIIDKLSKSINEIKHEPHMAELPMGKNELKRKKTPDGELREVAEFDSYEILKVPQELKLTREDIKTLFDIIDKTGIGKWSEHKTLEFWYLGYNEV
jgi:transposase